MAIGPKILVRGFGNNAPASTPPAAFDYFLDDYPGANRAYSLRKLRSAYTGDCITVRRDSDDTTQDIGFVNNVLDTTSLTTFVGAGSGYVTTWHCQVSAEDAVQTDTSLQPVIVSSGSLQTENGKSAINFGFRTTDNLGSFTSGDTSAIAVARSFGAVGTLNFAYGSGVSNRGGLGFDGVGGDGIAGNQIFVKSNTGNLETGVSGRTQSIVQYYIESDTTGTIYVDNTEEDTGTCQSTTQTAIGGRDGAFSLSGSIQEVIFYNTNQESTQTGQYTNLSNFYS